MNVAVLVNAMEYRLHILASVMASRSFMAMTLGATGIACIAQLLYPTVRWFMIIYGIVPFVVLVLAGLNFKPRYTVDLSYPGGHWVGPIAVGLFILAVGGMWVCGGVPEAREVMNGHYRFVVVNHDNGSDIPFYEFYILVALLPLAMTGLLVHCLLEHRWRYHKMRLMTNCKGKA